VPRHFVMLTFVNDLPSHHIWSLSNHAVQGQIIKSHSVGHSRRIRMGDQEGPVW